MKLDHYCMLEAFKSQDIEGICNGLKEHFGISFSSALAEIVDDDRHAGDEIILFSDKAYYSWSDVEGFTSHEFRHPLHTLLRICFAVKHEA